MSISQKHGDPRARVEDIFQKSLSSCDVIKGFALRVEFEDKTTICNTLERSPYTKNYYNRALFDLSKDWPLVVFDNATLEIRPNTPLSLTRNNDKILEQDPFHYDYLGVEKGDRQDKATLLFNGDNVTRQAPTYFALPDDIKLCIPEMRKLTISEDALDVLKKLAEEDFSFSLLDSVKDVRKAIRKDYPQFTDDLFKALPIEGKFSHTWHKDVDTVTMHSNDGEKLLHARGASTTDVNNKIMACDFYPS